MWKGPFLICVYVYFFLSKVVNQNKRLKVWLGFGDRKFPAGNLSFISLA